MQLSEAHFEVVREGRKVILRRREHMPLRVWLPAALLPVGVILALIVMMRWVRMTMPLWVGLSVCGACLVASAAALFLLRRAHRRAPIQIAVADLANSTLSAGASEPIPLASVRAVCVENPRRSAEEVGRDVAYPVDYFDFPASEVPVRWLILRLDDAEDVALLQVAREPRSRTSRLAEEFARALGVGVITD